MPKAESLGAAPVPAATQLIILPFLSAVHGYLVAKQDEDVRVTLHRLIVRDGKGYLQQACNYVGRGEGRSTAGRLFETDHRLIGAAFTSSKVWATKVYTDRADFEADLALDAASDGDEHVPASYLAVPLLYRSSAVAVLYAESSVFNAFAELARIEDVVAMCRGFCRFLDHLATKDVPMMENFPLESGHHTTGGKPQFRQVQAPINSILPPEFHTVRALHYDVLWR